MLELCVLGSGSKGNATLVRAGGSAILIDAGFSARELTARLDAFQQDPRRIAAVLLTHEHHDHVSGLRVFTQRHRIPVYATEATLLAADTETRRAPERYPIKTGESFTIGTLEITAFPIPHDAVDPVGFVVQAEGVRIGYCTDLGHVTTLVQERLTGCAALVFEANHDRAMLMEGPYPWPTKQRVASRTGHLSNDHAAAALPAIARHGAVHVVLGHMSETNNHPGLVRSIVASALADAGLGHIGLQVAPQSRPSESVRL